MAKLSITSNLAAKTYPMVVIVGETGSGKSSLAVALAKKFDGEIICADSWTVRREVNIGTAKPTLEERRQIPHHLLDIVEPCADFTAAVFKRLALRVMDDIAGRGKLPILVGGTGLYVDGVIFDFNFLPAGDRRSREDLNKLSAEELVQYAHHQGLGTEDIDVRNKRRVIRLIETAGAIPERQELRPNTLLLGLRIDNDHLKQKIVERIDRMMAAGLENEVRALAERYGWECEALKGIGYAQWREYFEDTQTLDQTRERIINNSMQLAKRQRTWFKRNKSIQWINDPSEAVEIVTTLLNKTTV